MQQQLSVPRHGLTGYGTLCVVVLLLLLLLQMREKLSQFQAENTLLGTLVKELKVGGGMLLC
jgi:hypothetical protein